MKTRLYGLDVDGVLLNFSQAFIEKCCSMGLPCPSDWTKVRGWMFVDEKVFYQVWKEIEKDEKFWLSLPPFEDAVKSIKKLPPPEVYVTHRPISSLITKQSLLNAGFPDAKVISVAEPENKVLQLKLNKVEVFVDDRITSCKYFRDNGIDCLLYDAPYHITEDTLNLPTIKSLKELKKYL